MLDDAKAGKETLMEIDANDKKGSNGNNSLKSDRRYKGTTEKEDSNICPDLTQSFKKKESPTNRRTVKRFKDEDKHRESSYRGEDTPPRPDSPASIIKSQRSRESYRKSFKKRDKEVKEDNDGDEHEIARINLKLSSNNNHNTDVPNTFSSRKENAQSSDMQKRVLE